MTAVANRPSTRRAGLVVGVVAVGLLGLLIGVLISRDDGPTRTVAASSQVASVQQACRQWMGDTPTMVGDPSWCTSMSAWMTDSMANNGMGPQMMWGDPDRMQATCEQWMSTNPPTGTNVDPTTWCTSMVDWMAGHMQAWSGNDSWNGWTMNGPMMGG